MAAVVAVGGCGGGGATRSHRFPAIRSEPAEELFAWCQSWTLENDEPLYVNAVGFKTSGGLHHSNWFFVPESYAGGPDGLWRCQDRGYDGTIAALQGGVTYASGPCAIVTARRSAGP